MLCDEIQVIHIASEVFADNRRFEWLMDDIATLHVLGVRVVVVVSVRSQVDARLLLDPWSERPVRVRGARVTGKAELSALQMECGLARSKVEAAMAKGLRTGGKLGPSATQAVDVIGGNSLYTARPLGVVDGVDLKSTGTVRHVAADKIARHLDAGDLVLLSALAYSVSIL